MQREIILNKVKFVCLKFGEKLREEEPMFKGSYGQIQLNA